MIEEEIIEYMRKQAPLEGCGLLVEKDNKTIWIPCRNTQEVEHVFSINSIDYIKAQIYADKILAIVHSHIGEEVPEPSDNDKKASDFLGIPYWIVGIPSGNISIYG